MSALNVTTVVNVSLQAKGLIDNYNRACEEFNRVNDYNNDQRAALITARLLEAASQLQRANLPLSGDPGKVMDRVKEIQDLYLDPTVGLNPQTINDPQLRDWFEKIPKPTKRVDTYECPAIDYPIPPLPASESTWGKIKETVKDGWDNARNWVRPRIDPLTLDLDGDGIETLGVNADNRVLFDHDGDGAKHGTGWVSADDAMLVLDRNNNGTIDNGRELFGDNTQLANGKFAADGFEALADMDSNGDGKINVDDTQFANLRLWRDLNQDGVSQTNELFTLGDYNIASINVAKVENTTTLANGNQIADLGTFTKTDGSTGNMADVNLLNDRFTRQFANTLDTSSVATLPDMQACTGMFLSSGSGAVRDLREAANDATYCIAA